MIFKIILFYLILIVVNCSKCPELTKPHDTNCAMFYNCINLPIDGFVWVPSKCNDNLVNYLDIYKIYIYIFLSGLVSAFKYFFYTSFVHSNIIMCLGISTIFKNGCSSQ